MRSFRRESAGRILRHGADNGEQLFLPGGNTGASGKNGVKTLRQRVNKFIKPAGSEDLFKLRAGNAFRVIDEVLPSRPLEEPGILQNHTEQLNIVVFSEPVGPAIANI